MSVGPVLGSATLRDGNWSRSNFFWGTYRFKRPNATLAANSGFDQPSMIALTSSRILELLQDCVRVADQPEPSEMACRIHPKWMENAEGTRVGNCAYMHC